MPPCSAFRMEVCTLRICSLRLRMRAVGAVAILAIVGAGHAEFHDCVATLDESPESQSAVVALPEIDTAGNPPTAHPRRLSSRIVYSRARAMC